MSTTPKLTIKDLQVSIEDKEILNGVNLEVKGGEIHAIMGPNGTGKSTLAQALMGHPRYEVTGGSVSLDGEDLLEMEVDERARKGLFLAMQYPSEISGVTNSDFLRSAVNARRGEGNELSIMKFMKQLDKKMDQLGMDETFASRYLNEGFSGGEKKRNEILQMMMLEPRIAILDEIDSGLDIDALKVVAEGVNSMRSPRAGLFDHHPLPTSAELCQTRFCSCGDEGADCKIRWTGAGGAAGSGRLRLGERRVGHRRRNR